MPRVNFQPRRLFGALRLAVYVGVLFVLLPAVIVISIEREIRKEEKLAFVGGLFVLLALPISLWEIAQHMVFYSRPHLQKNVIRILWMVPIYALNGWLGLVYPSGGIYFDCARECYEAYVIYNFLVYLLNYLNEEMDLEINLALKPQVKHIFPLCCLSDWKMGRELVYKCKHGILQYTVIRPVTTFIAFVCELKGVYGEGEFKLHVAFPYLIVVNNFSQFLAMYCLVLFYRANREELKPMQPVGKFLCIKLVVFFSFFQGVLISVAAYYGLLEFLQPTTDDQSINSLSNKVQNFLICIEMFAAAIAHHYVFSYEPYVNHIVEKRTLWDAFITMWDVSDVQADLKEHFEAVGNSFSNLNKQLRGQSSGESSTLISPTLPHSTTYSSIHT